VSVSQNDSKTIRHVARVVARFSRSAQCRLGHLLVLRWEEIVKLIEMTPEGTIASPIGQVPDIAREVMKSSAAMYHIAGYQPPWIGYLALDGASYVGACAFKTPPVDGRVEIAYFTFPGNEGRGVATSMARALIILAKRASPMIRIYAQTLPQYSASTRVLQKLGFEQTAEVDHPEDGKVWEWELIEKAQPR
jgi:RimJ/RimL family protein N-acetyltransferase